MPLITFIDGPLTGHTYDLPAGGAILGNGDTSNIVIEDDKLGERHAHIQRQGNAWVVADLQSASGLFINGKRRERATLREGSVVALGDSSFEVSFQTEPDDEIAGGADLAVVEELGASVQAIQRELGKVIIGQQNVIEEVMLAILCRGHALLVGVPGLAKTLIVSTLADVLDLQFKRIQFTPDLMPSDITGTDVLEEDPATGKRRFRFVPGPIFTNLLLADEINRTPPKTQAALLEAMQEHRVTVGAKTWPIAEPFFVLATQNPIEQEGTYPLPEAQLDRFMFNIVVDYPTADEEDQIIRQVTGNHHAQLSAILQAEDLLRLQDVVRRVPVADHVITFASSLARASRPKSDDSPAFVKEMVGWGAGPRAGINLILAAKARAVLHGRHHATTADVTAVALPVLRHRILTTFNAEANGVTSDELIRRLLNHVNPRAELRV